MKKLSLLTLTLALALALVAPVLAHELPSQAQGKKNGAVLATESARPASRLGTLRERIASKSADRLQNARLQACERVEKSLNTYITKITNVLNKHINTLSSIQNKIEALANKRQAETRVSNYASLLAKANAAHDAAEAAVEDIDGAVEIDCSADNPKAAVAEIKASFKDTKDAIKAYHKALRDLLVAVASVTGTENRSATSSATPSATP